MKMDEIVERLNGEMVHRGAGADETDVRHVIASDLMSDVLLTDVPHALLITSLASDQVIRTADIIGAVAVVVANGKVLPENMCRLATELNLTLIRSPLPKFEACAALAALARPV